MVDSIVVLGNVRRGTPAILADFGVRTGELTTRREIQRGIQSLFASGYFDDIRVFARGRVGTGATLVVEVAERPFIRSYEFEGLESVGDRSTRDSANLDSEQPLSPNSILLARNHLRKELADKGYVRANIDTTLVPTDAPGEYRLIFNVDEGRRLIVADLDFVGNESIPAEDLHSALTIKPEGFWWWRMGEFQQDAYREDLNVNLAKYYGSRGHLDFRVLGDSMIVDPETGKTRVIVRVDEGPQYRIAEFQIEGNKEFPTDLLTQLYVPGRRSLLSRLPLVGGDGEEVEGDPIFDAEEWKRATSDLRQLYRNNGYLFAQVEPVVERLSNAEDGSPRVRVKWLIEENEQAYVNLVKIAGNTNTHERVIRERVVVLPSDVYGDERLVNSYQNIQGLGFFEQLPPQEAVEIDPNQQGNIDITFRVAEKQTGNVSFGASVSPDVGVAGFVGYDEPNLFGQAKIGRFRWLFGSRATDIELEYRDPAVLGTRNSFSITLLNARDRFGFISLGGRRQTGGSLRFGTPFFGSRWTRISVGYSLFRDKFEGDESDLDLRQRELLSIGTRSSVDVRLTRDTRNSSLFPSRGSRNSVSMEFSGGAFGGDGNYRKLLFESSWFTTLASLQSGPRAAPIDLVLGLSMQGGSIFGTNPFLLERFFMGGTQYGVPLRGYEELTITPVGHVPRDLTAFSRLDRVGESYFTLTGQIGVRLAGQLFVNAFYDAGNVWQAPLGLNPTDLLRGAGVGVSMVTPLGPVGLDYAYGIDRRDVNGRPSPGWRLHLRLGQIF